MTAGRVGFVVCAGTVWGMAATTADTEKHVLSARAQLLSERIMSTPDLWLRDNLSRDLEVTLARLRAVTGTDH